MASIPKYLRPWFEPVAGAVFLVLWTAAEAGRTNPAAIPVILAALSLAIALSRVQPVASLVIVVVIPLLQVVEVLPRLTSTTWPIYLAMAFVGFVVSFTARPLLRWIALGVGPVVATMIAGLMVLPSSADVGWTSWTGQGQSSSTIGRLFVTVLVAAVAIYATAWTAGLAARLNLRHLSGISLLRSTRSELRDAEFDLRLATERDRIARDVHDVLAHSLSVVVAVADGARFLQATRPESTETALREIASTARSALVDVRGLVEGLRDTSGDRPQPGLADLASLVTRVESAGMPVDLEYFGEPQRLTPAQELAAFRIVQESLTNALKHSGAHPRSRVAFDWRGPGLALAISSSGDSPASIVEATVLPSTTSTPLPPRRAGQGIRGMEDRARLAGGWLASGWTDVAHTRFLVSAFIPAIEASAAA